MPSSPELPRADSLIQTIKEIKKPRTRTDTGWLYVGSGDPLAPDWQNGWSAGSETLVSFFLDSEGVVRFRGTVAGGDDGTVAFTLPVGYRPEYAQKFVGAGDFPGNMILIVIGTGGDVTISNFGFGG